MYRSESIPWLNTNVRNPSEVATEVHFQAALTVAMTSDWNPPRALHLIAMRCWLLKHLITFMQRIFFL